MAIDAGGFKQAMSRWASGVTVVTAQYDGVRHGMTVSSFASVSLDPPLVMVCIGKAAPTHDTIRKGERFVVNVLAETQEEISIRFATKHEDRFEGVALRTGQLGVPIIEGCLAAIECRLHETLPGGDHTIFVGEVVRADVADGSPLIYFQGGHRKTA
ncbi:MAG: flavin reductase family protein [Acidobacteria bacterium]|nr:flavin reductase family protein [Acidobacteriota bacterium]